MLDYFRAVDSGRASYGRGFRVRHEAVLEFSTNIVVLPWHPPTPRAWITLVVRLLLVTPLESVPDRSTTSYYSRRCPPLTFRLTRPGQDRCDHLMVLELCRKPLHSVAFIFVRGKGPIMDILTEQDELTAPTTSIKLSETACRRCRTQKVCHFFASSRTGPTIDTIVSTVPVVHFPDMCIFSSSVRGKHPDAHAATSEEWLAITPTPRTANILPPEEVDEPPSRDQITTTWKIENSDEVHLWDDVVMSLIYPSRRRLPHVQFQRQARRVRVNKCSVNTPE